MNNYRFNKNPNIAVIGDLMIDSYLWGKCERISPEAPVQVVNLEKRESLLGGAGNVANNLLALNANVYLYGVVGDDENAQEVAKILDQIKLPNRFLIQEKNRITTVKSRIMASKQQVLRLDSETTKPIKTLTEDKIFEKLKEDIEILDAIILSDYGKGVLTDRLTQLLIGLAKLKNKPILIDPKGDDYSKYKGATLLTPNKKEASIATKSLIYDDATLKKAGLQIKNECQLQYGIITLSEDGIAIFDDEMTKIQTVAKEVYDVTGAGDTVIASLAFALCNELSIKDACNFANHAAAVVVGKIGSATATLKEIEAYEKSINTYNAKEKIQSLETITYIIKTLKNENKKIVFTNGCFDILHRGHASYLEQAASIGDVLIVGLNSDASVKRLKGDLRPINTLEDRAFLLAALSSTDFIVPFEEDTPYELIKLIEPDVLIKGSDYKGKDIIGSDIAKEVVLIDYIEGKSTTNIIKKIGDHNR